ncbi:hypothetical protein ACH5RR_033638 [Cinchona calisaya]|uniref:Uncharacterized protein n=1 Tax=Cinchona calisaya TaxID=153742 RepID=A0ABD2YBJ0_9GENT
MATGSAAATDETLQSKIEEKSEDPAISIPNNGLIVAHDSTTEVVIATHFSNSLVMSSYETTPMINITQDVRVPINIGQQSLVNSGQFIHIKATHDEWVHSVAVTFVYAKCTQAKRRILLADLIYIAVSCPCPWVIVRDFNAIESVSKYLGRATQNARSMANFSNMIFQCGIKNIPITGNTYTWSGVKNGHPIWKRLDRILVNKQLEVLFPDSRVTHLSRTTSDHSLLLWTLHSNAKRGPKSLMFQAIWIQHHSFLHTVEDTWSQPVMGSSMLALSIKLWRLKACLREWQKNVFGDIFIAIKTAKAMVLQH